MPLNTILQALKHTSPPDFLVDTAVMPQARARVRLAVRLDALLRQQSKAAAEGAWRLRSAEAAGVDLSSDEEPAGPARLRGAAGGSSTAVVNIQQVQESERCWLLFQDMLECKP